MSIIRHCFAVCIRGIFQQSNKTVCIIFYSCWSILCNESEWRSNKMEPVWLMCQVISWAIFKGYCPFKGVKRIFLVLMLIFSMIMKAPECWYFSLLDRFSNLSTSVEEVFVSQLQIDFPDIKRIRATFKDTIKGIYDFKFDFWIILEYFVKCSLLIIF